MEEFKGTKGRWQMTTSALECDHNSEVATIWGDSEYGEGASLIAHIDNSPGVEKALANAKLINAAPELLKALQEMLEKFDYSEQSTYSFAAKEIDAAKEAIKKATE